MLERLHRENEEALNLLSVNSSVNATPPNTALNPPTPPLSQVEGLASIQSDLPPPPTYVGDRRNHKQRQDGAPPSKSEERRRRRQHHHHRLIVV